MENNEKSFVVGALRKSQNKKKIEKWQKIKIEKFYRKKNYLEKYFLSNLNPKCIKWIFEKKIIKNRQYPSILRNST